MSEAASPDSKPPVRLGDKLVGLGLITQDQLRIALQEQKSTGKPLGEGVIRQGVEGTIAGGISISEAQSAEVVVGARRMHVLPTPLSSFSIHAADESAAQALAQAPLLETARV